MDCELVLPELYYNAVYMNLDLILQISLHLCLIDLSMACVFLLPVPTL